MTTRRDILITFSASVTAPRSALGQTKPMPVRPSGDLPYLLPAPGKVTRLGHTLIDVCPSPNQGMLTRQYWLDTLLRAYGAGCFNRWYSRHGAYLIGPSGGHTSPDNVGVAGMDYSTGRCIRIDPVGGENMYRSPRSYDAKETTGDPNYEILLPDGKFIPAPGHTTQTLAAAPIGPKGRILRLAQTAICNGSFGTTAIHWFDCAERMYGRLVTRVGDARGSSGSRHYGYSVPDVARNCIWTLSSNEQYFGHIEKLDLADMTIKVSGPSFTAFAAAGWSDGAVFLFGGLLIRLGLNRTLVAFNPETPMRAPFQLRVKGELPAAFRNWFVPLNGRLYAVPEKPGDATTTEYNSLYRLTPPSDLENGEWVCEQIESAPYPSTRLISSVAFSRLHCIESLQMLGWFGYEGTPCVINPHVTPLPLPGR